ncbi:MAG: carboxypeptidase, partial [Actinobacteria bacterium]|nr:carboxypeptidase [Actinomycetota bacterium]
MRRRTLPPPIAAALSLVLAAAAFAAVGGPPATAADTGPAAFQPQLVRVATPEVADLATLERLGLDRTEHSGRTTSEVLLHTAAERTALRSSGLTWTVLVDDLVRREAANAAADAAYAASTARSALPSGRTAYRTLSDYETEMAAMATEHPGLVRLRTLPFTTLDGHEVHGLEIGTDVGRPASGRPTFVMVGLHHAREWPSAEHTMEFAIDLVDGFGTDRRITALLGRARVVVVPIVNVDGFDLSRTSGGIVDLNILNPLDPTGALLPTLATAATPGLAYLRKNCRIVDGVDTPDGTCGLQLSSPAGFSLGVDLNRNYGMWWGGPGAAHQAPDAEDATAGFADPRYQGAAAFSEPETQNVRSVVLSRAVTGLITNHTSGNLVLRPWASAPDNVTSTGTTVGVPRDEAALKRLGDLFATQ